MAIYCLKRYISASSDQPTRNHRGGLFAEQGKLAFVRSKQRIDEASEVSLCRQHRKYDICNSHVWPGGGVLFSDIFLRTQGGER
jgi:hypothetical protein